MVTFGPVSFEGANNAPLQTEKQGGVCMIFSVGCFFLFWDYLISQEIILFQLSSPPINSDFLGERVVVEECVCVCVCVCNVSQSSWVLGPPQLPPSESGILKA